MGLIYGVTWYAMSLAMPGIFSLNTILRDCLEPDERTAEGLRFWLKYWVVFAYYFILEFVLDCFISWVPFYSEVSFYLFYSHGHVSFGQGPIFCSYVISDWNRNNCFGVKSI